MPIQLCPKKDIFAFSFYNQILMNVIIFSIIIFYIEVLPKCYHSIKYEMTKHFLTEAPLLLLAPSPFADFASPPELDTFLGPSFKYLILKFYK